MVAGGRLSDYLINKGSSLIWVRKSMAFIGMAGSAIALLFMQDAQSAEIAMLLMVTALAFLSINYAGVVPNILDVAPNHADILYGFINTLLHHTVSATPGGHNTNKMLLVFFFFHGR